MNNIRKIKYKKGLRGWLGLGLIGFGLITLPLPTGSPLFILVGGLLMNPIKLKYQLRSIKEDLKHTIKKRVVLWGLI